MKNLKIIIAILCVCLICIDAVYLLTKPQKTEQKTPAQTTKEVVFWSLQMGTFNNYMNPLIEQFEKENPDIKIKWIDVPYSEGEKRTLASILSTTPPDLVNLTPDFSSVLAQKQALHYIDCNKLNAYNPLIIDMLKQDGKCYAIPFYATSSLTFYNKKILDDSAITSIPKTYDEMNALAPRIKEKTGKFVTMPTLTENDTLLKILNKYNINTPESIVSNKSVKIFNDYKYLYNCVII